MWLTITSLGSLTFLPGGTQWTRSQTSNGTSPRGLGTPGEGESNPHLPAAGIPAGSRQCESRHPQGCRCPHYEDPTRTDHHFQVQAACFLVTRQRNVRLNFIDRRWRRKVLVNRALTKQHPFCRRFPHDFSRSVSIQGDAREDCCYDRPLPAGVDVSGLRFEYVPEVHSHGSMPPGVAGQFTAALFAAHYFYVVGAIMVISGDPAAGEPVCGARPDIAGSRAFQHSYVSSPDEPERHWDGGVCDASLAAGCLGASSGVCEAVCGTA